ncbi:hypothetical protein GCM10028813_33700 [Ramlibacter alkalitolerans]
MDNQELISALADGQLQGEAFARGVQAASADARARTTWCAYHVAGEVLRSGSTARGTPPEAFLARLRERLKQEAPQAAPARAAAQVQRQEQRPAANDWLWKLTAGVASMAAVAAVGWNVWSGSAAPAAQPQLAVAPAPVAPAAGDVVNATLIRDPRLDQLLQAHRQLAGTTVLQTPSGFLRNATFEAPGR